MVRGLLRSPAPWQLLFHGTPGGSVHLSWPRTRCMAALRRQALRLRRTAVAPDAVAPKRAIDHRRVPACLPNDHSAAQTPLASAPQSSNEWPWSGDDGPRVPPLSASTRRDVVSSSGRITIYGEAYVTMPLHTVCCNSTPKGCHNWSMMDTRGHHRSPYGRVRKMKFFSIQDLPETMKISEKWVRRSIRRDAITAYRIVERDGLRVKNLCLEQYVEAQRIKIRKAITPNTEVRK